MTKEELEQIKERVDQLGNYDAAGGDLVRLIAEVTQSWIEVEQLRVQLAGCSVAALGYAKDENDAKPGDYGYSASFQDVKNLYAEKERLRALMDEVKGDADRFKSDYEGACKTIAAMHEAAMGKVCGSKRGVVEDVADIREYGRNLFRAIMTEMGKHHCDSPEWKALANVIEGVGGSVSVCGPFMTTPGERPSTEIEDRTILLARVFMDVLPTIWDHLGTSECQRLGTQILNAFPELTTPPIDTALKSMSETKPFGKRLAMLREDAGLSQSGLARIMGTSQSAISQIEAGERNPTLGTLIQIGAALNVSPGFLIDREVEHLTFQEERLFVQCRALTKKQRSSLDEYIAFLRHNHG